MIDFRKNSAAKWPPDNHLITELGGITHIYLAISFLRLFYPIPFERLWKIPNSIISHGYFSLSISLTNRFNLVQNDYDVVNQTSTQRHTKTDSGKELVGIFSS